MEWRDWLSIVAVLLLLLSFFFEYWWVNRRKRVGPIEDLPERDVEWRPEYSVFDEPERFGYRVYTDRCDQILEVANQPARAEAVRDALLDHIKDVAAGAVDQLAQYLRDRGIGSSSAVCILIDQSGSMIRKPGTGPDHHSRRELVVPDDCGAAVAAHIAIVIASALEKCGATIEILGFTTVQWRGGEARQDWINAGRPARPGRLNDLLHIIYKRVDESSVAACMHRLEMLLDPSVLKENIDGEAIAWARNRLLSLSGSDRLLILVSDGAPVDDSTLHENGPRYLERHLMYVIEDMRRRMDLRIVGIGIGYEVRRYIPESLMVGDVKLEFNKQVREIADLIGGTIQ